MHGGWDTYHDNRLAGDSIQLMRVTQKALVGGERLSQTKGIVKDLTQASSVRVFFAEEQMSMDQLLSEKSRYICEKYKIEFSQLTQIQRKFVTHFRCHRCRLLPLYYIDMSHVKRVRCRKCGELVSFKNGSKFGKLRKEIACELKEIFGDGLRVPQ
jgi:hypothetical protein